MPQDIKPTRSELLKLKKQIRLARGGYNLLKKKRDGLILEFFEILKRAKTLREELVSEYKIALEKMNIARTLEGDLKVKSIAMAIKDMPSVSITTKNIMGVRVPRIEASEIKTSMRKLLNEIEKTKRRVNALEFVVMPSLEKVKSFIQLRLEELERENIFRMKRIKAKS